MRKLIKTAGTVGLMLFAGLLQSAGVSSETTIAEAISKGEAKLGFRYRYEYVDQDGIDNTAGASSLMTRITYRSKAWRNLSLVFEADDVTYAGSERFNNTRNGEVGYPVVADPDGTDVNQAYLSLKLGDCELHLGRQRIVLAGQRFVGGVAWRQNEQTYDAIRIQQPFAKSWNVDYSYVNRVSRVFGPDDGVPSDALDSNFHFLHVTGGFGYRGKVCLFGYAMDFDDAPALSNRTLGLSY